MESAFLSKTSAEKALEAFKSVVEIGTQFKLREEVIPSNLSFPELYQLVGESIPSGGLEMEKLLQFVSEQIVSNSTNFASPFAMAFPDAGNSIAGISGAILSDFLNQNLIRWVPCSPMATVVEMVVINWLRELIGFPFEKNPAGPQEVGGIVTSGGVASNTLALLLARERAFPGTMSNGVHKISQQFVSIVPDFINHYSSRQSSGWLGMGEVSVIKAPTKHFKYDIPMLYNILRDLKSAGKIIVCLTAYAGDSYSMTCDNLVVLRKICDEFGIWFHVDGCHGTQLLFSDKLRTRVQGIELADSVTFDPHKVMTVPYVVSLIVFKNPDVLKLIQRPEDIITKEEHSFGNITPLFGSRNFNSLKLYMLIKNLGKGGLAEMIEKRCELATQLADMIEKDPELVLLNPEIGINSVLFMFKPNRFKVNTLVDLEMLIDLNTKLHTELLEEGDFWLHTFEIPDSSNVFGFGEDVVLRPMRFLGGNPVTTREHVELMLESVKTRGLNISRSLGIALN